MSADYMEALRVQLAYAERRQYAGKITRLEVRRDVGEAIDGAIDLLLEYGQPVFVAPWVEAAAWDAAASVPASVVCERDLMPAEAGFMLLSGGHEIAIEDALRPAIGGLMRARVDAIGWVGMEAAESHRTLYMLVPWLSAPTDPPHQGHWSTVAGMPVEGTGVSGPLVPPTSTTDVAALRRLLYALWSFMAEKRVTTVTHKSVDRALRKQAERAGWAHEPIVQVVELRASESRLHDADAEHQTVDWSCRWAVRGHWRQQFYASDGTHRARWISAHIKGPAGKPLRAATKLLAVVR